MRRLRRVGVCERDTGKSTIAPTRHAVRSYPDGSGKLHLKSWAVETSAGGEKWRELDHQEDDNESNGDVVTRNSVVRGGEACRFVRVVNIGRNHRGDRMPRISAGEVFGTLIE
jgi:hypothetical protein